MANAKDASAEEPKVEPTTAPEPAAPQEPKAPQEPETKETKPAEESKAEPESKPESVETPAAEEPKPEEPGAEEAKGEEKPAEAKDTEAEEPKGEKPRDETKEKARQAYQQRQKTRQQIAQQVDQYYGPKTKDDLVGEGMEEVKAEVEALRQEIEFRDTRDYVADLNAGLKLDANRVLKDLPVFNPGTKENPNPNYDPEFAKEVQEMYQQASRLETDENGIVINAEIPLYDFYARAAKIREGGSKKGQASGQQDALKMLSRTETPASQTQPQPDKKPGDMSIKEMEAKYGFAPRL